MSLPDPVKIYALPILLSFISAFSGVKVADINRASSQDQLLVQQLQDEREINRVLKEKLFKLEIDFVDLKAQVTKTFANEDIAKAVFAGLQKPAWIKRVDNITSDKPDITLWYLNPAYSEKYGVSYPKYRGKSDATIWGDQIARGFFLADMRVLSDMGSRCGLEKVYESVPKGITLHERYENLMQLNVVETYICKWIIQLPSGLYIAGLDVGQVPDGLKEVYQ